MGVRHRFVRILRSPLLELGSPGGVWPHCGMIQLHNENTTEVRKLMQCTTRQWQPVQSQVMVKVGEIIADMIEK